MSSRHFRVERIVRSAIRRLERDFQTRTYEQLSVQTCGAIDALLSTSARVQSEPDTAQDTLEITAFAELKTGPGAATVKSVQRELAKLERIDALGLPDHLFADAPPRLVQSFRRRAAVEPPRELRNHAGPTRYWSYPDLVNRLVKSRCLIVEWAHPSR